MHSLAAHSTSHTPLHQRASGCLDIALETRGGLTGLTRFYQEGCLKARHLRDRNYHEIISMNISGGIAGGDVLTSEVKLGAGTKAVFTSQAAERVYKTIGEPSRITTRLKLGQDASLKYLPQDTILFDGLNLDRRLEIDLTGNAICVGLESIVFGRAAMGESVRSGVLRDRVILRRNGKVVWQDALIADGDIAAFLAMPGVGRQTRAIAGLFFVGLDTNDVVRRLEGHLQCYLGGISMCDDVIFLRIMAPDSKTLRQAIIGALDHMNLGILPRVWQS